jgi:hypothetical protein
MVVRHRTVYSWHSIQMVDDTELDDVVFKRKSCNVIFMLPESEGTRGGFKG